MSEIHERSGLPRSGLPEITEDLAGTVRAAAAAAPPHPGDLAAVRRRARAVSRHRTVTASGLVALGVAAMLGFGLPADRQPEPSQAAQPTPTPSPAPAQRLLIDGTGYILQLGEQPPAPEPTATGRALYEWYQGKPGVSGVLGTLAEVLPDGNVVELDLGDLPGINNGVRDVMALPDGRLVVIGLVDLRPGVTREDGPCVDWVEFRLLVVEADGSVSSSRNVREMCQELYLVGADGVSAYLVRGSRLVAHDLVTGDETVLFDSPEVAELAARGSVAAGRFAAIVETRPAGTVCMDGGPVVRIQVQVIALATGQAAAFRLTTGGGCSDLAGPVRLSPDGRHAAVAYHRLRSGGKGDLRLAVLDLATGRVVADELVLAAGEVSVLEASGMTVGNGAGAIAGMAWQDDRTLRYAWYGAPEQGVHWLPDLVQVETVSIE